MSDLTPGLDPKPVAPTPPGPDDCCHSGCTWCVLDLYQEELEKYREALKQWEARQKTRQR
ncbi:oxidoreductase-like domain-containing protein [Pseudoduganella sp. UC29_106]|uniref:oxidoreductase-like domain-containing protein n=1 Tax=Pseudoduganella sp. UC29_106 TaxID=3374553 RepID=UPI0037584144